MSGFRQISPKEWGANPFQAIGEQWMLVCAQGPQRPNLMTASWGGVGVLWNKPVTYVFVRPQRFTRGLVDGGEAFSLLFFDERYREQLKLCGAKSGRDIDKVKECGFTAARHEGVPYVEEASAAVFCSKLYQQDLSAESFLLPELVTKNYPGADFHRMYVSEITGILVKE